MKSKRNNSIVRLFSFTQKEVFSNSNKISIKRVNNRTINDDVLVFNAVLLSSYDVIDDSLIDSSNGLLGYYNNSLCLTVATISISAVLSSAGINISQAISMTLELEGSISPFYGYIDIYDSNGDYFDTIDCTDGHNPLEIDIKAIYEQSGSASFALIPVEPCSGVTLFNPANAQIRLTYHPLDLSYFSSVGYINQQLFDKYKEFLPISVKDYSFKIDKSFGLPYIDKTLFFLKGKHLPIFLQLKFVYPHHFDGFNSFGGFPFIGNINPIRYRSYYYDTDLKMYWLTTRYYDPEVGRFISPDHYSYLDYQKLHGLNLYAYSKNNPVMYYDPSGHSAWENFWKCLGNWFKDTFGGFVDYTKKVFGFRDDYFFFGHETGIRINVPTSNNEKPIYFFASSADEWWKFWEYQIGIRINIGKTYFAYSFGFGEANFSYGSENSSVNIQMGINKYSVEFSGEKDGVVSYNQFYIRTIPTAALVLACMYAPYTVPVAAALIFGC